jgi:hypothetical protein
MIRLKIDLLKLAGARTFTAKDGAECIGFPLKPNNVFVGKNGAHYLDLTLMDNRDGVDQYGNNGFCTVDVGKERRMAGEKSPILGNWKDMDGGGQGRDVPASEAMRKPAGQHQAAKQDGYAPDDSDDSEIPF